jgi:hypothetical protein
LSSDNRNNTAVRPTADHGCPVERSRLFVARSIQLEIPLAGLVPAIHAFPSVHKATFQDVGGRDKPGQGEQKVVPVSSAPSCSCSEKLNRTAVTADRARTRHLALMAPAEGLRSLASVRDIDNIATICYATQTF